MSRAVTDKIITEGKRAAKTVFPKSCMLEAIAYKNKGGLCNQVVCELQLAFSKSHGAKFIN